MSTNPCPCGTQKKYADCCGPFIGGERAAPTAEALMRSRYSAYVKHEIDYIERTHDANTRKQFDRAAATAWSEQTEWKSLEIRATALGGSADVEGSVEFVARFKTNGVEQDHHELSLFRKEEGVWVYVDGKLVKKPVHREGPKIGRNDPCPCGSGKKHKKCCALN